MFNLLIALITGVVIGWNFHAFYTQLTPPMVLKSDINISEIVEKKPIQKTPLEINTTEKTIIEKNITTPLTPLKTNISMPTKNETDSFYTLLEKNLFSDAMALYLEAESQKVSLYKKTLLAYFKIKSTSNPQEAIRQMIEFKELEPKHKAVALELINTYKSIRQYPDALDIITQLIETVPPSELDALHANLIETSQSYIDELNTAKSFQNLVNFLEERIVVGIKTPFYIYALANHYLQTEQYDASSQLLKEIEYDYDYGEKAKKLLELINNKDSQNKQYTYELNLEKLGEHFTVEVNVNNTPLTLLLDTGATLTMVNESKLPLLTLIQENITLNTAGGEINADLQEAESFSIGDIELKKFEIVSSSFEQENADGLLGMNFFKQFNFKIDQEKGLLHLSKKEDTKADI